MRVLYVGADRGTSRHRALALRRLGYQVDHVDPWRLVPNTRLLGAWVRKVGGPFVEGFVRDRVLRVVPRRPFDVVLVDAVELVGPSLVRALRSRASAVVSYCIDDPFGTRDGRRWTLYRRAVRAYDLTVVVRSVNEVEARARGARRVLRVFMSADEVAHAPRAVSEEDRRRLGSEILFAGTWMPGRGRIVRHLLVNGLPVSVYGDRWHRAPEWEAIRSAWRGPSLLDSDYAKTIGLARVCLGLISHGNRDEHTTRSMEIPFAGGILCAERTGEHAALYRDGEEALLWNDEDELVARLRNLLVDPERQEGLRRQGRARAIENGHLNQTTLREICTKVISDAGFADESPSMEAVL